MAHSPEQGGGHEPKGHGPLGGSTGHGKEGWIQSISNGMAELLWASGGGAGSEIAQHVPEDLLAPGKAGGQSPHGGGKEQH